MEALLRRDGQPPAPPGAGLALRRGAFVSLHAGGALRGCVGHVVADRTLGDLVPRMAIAAAREDARFAPVTPDELTRLRVEISVLGEPTRLEPVEPSRLVVGRDGLIVRRGRALGVLLPQVARGRGWTAEALLAAACRKAGLEPAAWREPGAEVLVFQADVFAEA